MTANDVKYIVIHCSATKPTIDVGAVEIDQWHKAKGWAGIGYHFVIRRNGTIEPGRPLDQSHTPGWQIMQGAHVAGWNSQSVGICLIGGIDDKGKPASNYTDEQWETLRYLVEVLRRIFPRAKAIGHTDLDPGKACPCFDVGEWSQILGA
jgi:N-acetyl-anhydromuramyl-L-alanine amidase AmpD